MSIHSCYLLLWSLIIFLLFKIRYIFFFYCFYYIYFGACHTHTHTYTFTQVKIEPKWNVLYKCSYIIFQILNNRFLNTQKLEKSWCMRKSKSKYRLWTIISIVQKRKHMTRMKEYSNTISSCCCCYFLHIFICKYKKNTIVFWIMFFFSSLNALKKITNEMFIIKTNMQAVYIDKTLVSLSFFFLFI